MKNKKIFCKLYISLYIIFIISLITLYILGYKTRIGYISNIELNAENTLTLNNLEDLKELFTINDKLDEDAIKNYISTNSNIINYSYHFKIKYYSKIFGNSDIYGVYPNTNKILQDNNFIREIKMDGDGSPFGNLVSTKELKYDDIIDNINYKLSVKLSIIISSLVVLFIPYIMTNKNRKELSKYLKNIIIFARKKSINIKLYNIMIIGYIYLILPYILFLITWTKYYIGIPITAVLCIGLYFLFKNTVINYKKDYIFNLFSLIVLFLFVTLVVILLGIGNICTPSPDVLNIREAYFRDLINFQWPLIYPKSGYGYVNYFAAWVVPSLFGKIFGYNFAEIMLILWTSVPIFLTILLISMYFNKCSFNYIFIITFIFILHETPSLFFYPETKKVITFFSSFLGVSSYLNQVPAIYLMSMLFIHQKNSYNFSFLGLSVMFYSPYAVLGIVPFMIVKAILDIHNNGYQELKNIFSASNIVFSLTIFPVLFLYLSSSATTSDGLKFVLSEYKLPYLLELFFIKFAFLYLLLFKYNKKNYIFYVSFIVIVMVSFFRYSFDHNFHRVNIGSLFFLTIFLIDYFINYSDINNVRKYLIIFIFMLGIFRGSYNNFNQINYYMKQIKSFGKVNIDSILYNKTYNVPHNNGWFLKTITCQNMDKSIFFKYIAKDKKQ